MRFTPSHLHLKLSSVVRHLHQLTMAATAEGVEDELPRTANPPPVITVETKEAEQSEKSFGQESRTPKHANKKEDGNETQPKITPDRLEKPEERQGYSSHPFEGRGGAFQPHEPRRQAPPSEYYSSRGPSQSMHHLSPRGTRYYAPNPPRSRMEGSFPPQPYYDQHPPYADYGPPPGRHFDAPPPHFDVPPPPSYRGNFPGQYPPGPPHPSYGAAFPPERYQVGNSGGYYPPQSGVPVENYPRDPRYNNQHMHAVPRAGSSSFVQSIKGGEKPRMHKPHSPNAHEDSSLASGDSWKMLKNVHSVDESALRERLKKESPPIDEKQPASTSSSLTNSPTEGAARLAAAHEAERTVNAAAAAVSTSNQNPSSLDSLASVASQQVMETDKGKTGHPTSPGTDSASLDLMKCSSGSSGLLHLPVDSKRGRDEQRGDVNTASTGAAVGEEIRRAPSEGEPSVKKARVEAGFKREETNGKSSPLSITCSPSASKAKEAASRMRPPMSKSEYHASPQPLEGTLYDKRTMYTNQMESAPPLPRGIPPGHKKQPSYPSLPPRPGSSNSSTVTPAMQGIDHANVTGAASWEIHAQDSFGNASIGGGQGLTSSFSFQDYPMLPPSESGDAGSAGLPPPVTNASHLHQMQHHHHPSLESRNQSFEGGHYHGSFDYGPGRPGMVYGGSGHMGQFPPHAPSWGTAGSGSSYHPPPPGHYATYGGRGPPDYPVMRNYSHDSAHRTSPPMGPGMHGMRPVGAPPGFQPPSEFAAPHNPHLTRRPPPAVYIMPTSQGDVGGKRGGGAFSWSKDDDNRLTDIMKKHKNPRDWEPISKELGRGKNAKECHERWIRYLKPGVRKGQWTDQEDAIVIEAVTSSAEQPFTRWSDLAQQLPGRVGKQIRDRWVNHLNPNINHLPFSREDDLNLWNGHKKLGKRWVEISTKYFDSNRSENHIKNRWYSASFKKFITNEFGADAYSGTAKASAKKDKKKKTSRGLDMEDPTISAI